MRATIAARARAGAAVLLSSHLLHLVEELCTRLLVIQHGEIVAIGTIAEIIAERPQLAGQGLEDLFLALTGDNGGAERLAGRRLPLPASCIRCATARGCSCAACARRATPWRCSRRGVYY